MTGVSKFLVAALLLTGYTHAAAEPVAGRAKVNGMQMYYEVSGAGDPLVVLHGAYMNILSMGAIIPKLAETHKVMRSSCRATVAPPIATGRSPTRTWRTTWRASWTRWA